VPSEEELSSMEFVCLLVIKFCLMERVGITGSVNGQQ
jgi:hypothetical protein